MYRIYVPGTVLRYGAITMNNINLPSWNSLLKECPHGICQFYLLSILRNLSTPPRPRVPSDRISCRRCSNSRVGTTRPYHPLQEKGPGMGLKSWLLYTLSLASEVNQHETPAPKGHSVQDPDWPAYLRVSFLGRLTVRKTRVNYSVSSEAMEGDRSELSHQNGGVSNIKNNGLRNLQRNVLWGKYLLSVS